MTAADFDEFLDVLQEHREDPERVRVGAMLSVCCVDPTTGARVFHRGDVKTLSKLPFSRLMKLYEACEELNKADDPKGTAAGDSRPADGWPAASA